MAGRANILNQGYYYYKAKDDLLIQLQDIDKINKDLFEDAAVLAANQKAPSEPGDRTPDHSDNGLASPHPSERLSDGSREDGGYSPFRLRDHTPPASTRRMERSSETTRERSPIRPAIAPGRDSSTPYVCHDAS